MIIYGANPVREAIRANPRKIRYIAIANDQSGRMQKLVEEARGGNVNVRFISADQLRRLAPKGAVHNGVVAEVSEVGYADFEELVADEKTRVLFLLDGIQDPQNLGAILRVADGFGVNGIVLPEHESVGLTPVAIKASAGAAEWVAVSQVTNLARSIEMLKEAGFWVYGTAADGDPLGSIDLTGRVAIVLGSEGKGVRRLVAERCDRMIAISLRGRVESLNVATAAAVVAYEIDRQNAPK